MAQARFVDYSTSDHYQVLGLNRGASQAEIARAYKEKARQLHPDKNPDDKEAAELSFKRIADAYAVLRDPHKRQQYDQTGAGRSYVSYDEAEHMWDTFCRNEGSSTASRREEPRDSEGRQKVILLVSLFALFMYAPAGLLPFVVAWLAATALQNHGHVVRISCAMLAYMLASSAVQWSQGYSYSAAPEIDLKDLHGLVGSNTGPSSLGLPRSGEELMMIDGRFARVADPLGAESGDVQHGWEQRLVDAMVKAINSGQCQVLLVFSREGCPWCDRQLPVLRNAIKQRAAYVSGSHQRASPTASGQSPASEVTELDNQAPRVPLRVFIMDADELPELTETFQVEGFPTTVAWVTPNAQPLLVPGFLDDENMAEMLRQPAPEDPPAAPSADVKPAPSLRANA